MEVTEYPVYERCRTCGDFFIKSETVQAAFCSNICALHYTECANCGRYFPSPGPPARGEASGIKKVKNREDFCSPDCAVVYEKETKDYTEINTAGGFEWN
ncbi:MAG: hypothetical protein AB1798_22245 [Spirochaetota bacterium]